MFSDRLADYDFDLPPELIAQSPAARREDARLLLVRRNPSRGEPRFEDLRVADLPQLVRETPSLARATWVRNRSRVIPARFYARRPTGGRHEIVLLEEIEPNLWRALVRGQADLRYPQKLRADTAAPWDAEFVSPSPGVIDLRQLSLPSRKWLEHVGEMPLPPYIKQREATRDRDRYQALWAQEDQAHSVAAPTASLHFSEEMCRELERDCGVHFADLYLHVGLGTFEPVREEFLSKHELHAERLWVPGQTIAQLEKAEGMMCVGTTAFRALESLGLRGDAPDSRAQLTRGGHGIGGSTRLFVRPGFTPRYATALWTNFHLPSSTLFVLVSVFAGDPRLAQEAYAHAIARNYRFFSYGDVSLWV